MRTDAQSRVPGSFRLIDAHAEWRGFLLGAVAMELCVGFVAEPAAR